MVMMWGGLFLMSEIPLCGLTRGGGGAYNVQGEVVSGGERHESLDAPQLNLPVI